MPDEQNIRPLTKEEKLIWEISFLENSIKQQKEELKDCNEELKKIKAKRRLNRYVKDKR